MNNYAVDGIVKHIHTSGKEKQSAILLIQYGPQRKRDENKPVEFVNALAVRVPAYLWEKVKEISKVDSYVEIKGRLQGVMKGLMTEGYITTELVAEQVRESKLLDLIASTSATETAEPVQENPISVQEVKQAVEA